MQILRIFRGSGQGSEFFTSIEQRNYMARDHLLTKLSLVYFQCLQLFRPIDFHRFTAILPSFCDKGVHL